MNALLLTLAVAAAEPQGTPLYNARSLVDRDWVATYTTETTDRYGRTTRDRSQRVLSLRAGDDWDSGKAWVFHLPQSGPPQAWKGFYTVYNDADDEDNIVVTLRMTRRYTGRATGDGIEWTLDDRWDAVGAYVDLPITDRTVPDRLSLTSLRAFYVNAKGDPIRRYHEPSGLIDSLLHGREEDIPYRADFLPKNTTFQFTDVGADDALKRLASKPPSYTPRASRD